MPVRHPASDQRSRIRVTSRSAPRPVKSENNRLLVPNHLVEVLAGQPFRLRHPRIRRVGDLIQEIGPQLLHIVRRVPEHAGIRLDRRPTRLTRRTVQHAPIRMIRRTPVRVPQPGHQRVHIGQVGASRGLPVVVEHHRRVPQLPLHTQQMRIRGLFRHRPVTGNESVRGLQGAATHFRAVCADRLRQQRPTVTRNPLLRLVQHPEHRPGALQGAARRRDPLNLPDRQVDHSLHRLKTRVGVHNRRLLTHGENGVPGVLGLEL